MKTCDNGTPCGGQKSRSGVSRRPLVSFKNVLHHRLFSECITAEICFCNKPCVYDIVKVTILSGCWWKSNFMQVVLSILQFVALHYRLYLFNCLAPAINFIAEINFISNVIIFIFRLSLKGWKVIKPYVLVTVLGICEFERGCRVNLPAYNNYCFVLKGPNIFCCCVTECVMVEFCVWPEVHKISVQFDWFSYWLGNVDSNHLVISTAGIVKRCWVSLMPLL